MNHAPALSVRQGLVYVSTAAVAWGTGGAAGALLHGAGQLSPVAVSFWRFACGAVLLLAVARSRPSWRVVLLVGPAMAVCQAAYFAAIAEAGVAVATMITMGAAPLLVAAGGRIFLGERLGRTGLGCAALAVAGLAMLTGGAQTVTPAGAGYSLLSAAAYCCVTLTTRRMPADGVAVWGFAGGAACLLPLAASGGLLPAGHTVTSMVTSVLLLGYLAAVPTALAYGLFFAGLRVVGGTTAAVLSLLEPLVAAVIGIVLLGERMSAVQVGGAMVLLCALAWLARGELRDAPHQHKGSGSC
ncbi:EamA family transporter [Microbispora sp. SCL1-1]|uniref:DMT family transporter n=1 Tax=unclassified Microbispora TaxID=2614687 RepID=UPI001158DF8A|nr:MULTISPECIES: EamA family transporter [unclassified Microbispora]NJP23739.1 EamA family transporter [Microbispora sp. CL1-1]TQS15943.1 EamA family transporter [Microbispora sp. SCL1-1]